MKFDDLDARMRVYETALDQTVVPDVHIAARLDGRNFTRLTKETLELEAPFDERFRDAMADAVEHLMSVGFRVLYGYTQSDEISLLFEQNEDSFGRKLRKFNSVLAGEASAKFSLTMGVAAAFDCRLCLLPTEETVVDYFRWRNEDAHRNALNAHCYWRLRDEGRSVQAATKQLSGMSVAQKNELLFERGVNYNDLPAWQKRGVGCYWETYEKDGLNPTTGEANPTQRRRIVRDLNLPMRDAYSEFVRGLLRNQDGR